MPRRPKQLPDVEGRYQCGKCEKWRSPDAFYYLKSGKRAGTRMFPCKICSRKARPKYKPASYNKRRALIAVLKARPCIRCGEQFHPAAMDFHHRDPAMKAHDWDGHVSTWSVKRILAEVEKCDVICANCHRILHYEERERAREGGDA